MALVAAAFLFLADWPRPFLVLGGSSILASSSISGSPKLISSDSDFLNVTCFLTFGGDFRFRVFFAGFSGSAKS